MGHWWDTRRAKHQGLETHSTLSTAGEVEARQSVTYLLPYACMARSVSYYSERVRNRFYTLRAGILADYLRIVELLQEHDADLGMPHSRALSGGLFELRSKGREGIGRVLYCTAVERTIIVLHSFVKKTQDTPHKELRTARKRMEEAKRNG